MTEVQRGMLKYYHRGLLSKKWKEYKFILYDSSLLTWYTDNKHKKPDGIILLKNIERFICVGPYTKCLPDFPHLDNEYDQIGLIAFPMSIQNRDRDIIWLLCKDIQDLNSWMKAIVQTLSLYTLQINKDIPMDLKSTTSLENPKINPLKKAGYNYGDTLWGTGEGWGYFSPLTIPGFAAIGGNGYYANHIDLIHNEDNEQRISDGEEVVYALAEDTNDDDDDDIDLEDDEDGMFPQIQETLEMIHGHG